MKRRIAGCLLMGLGTLATSRVTAQETPESAPIRVASPELAAPASAALEASELSPLPPAEEIPNGWTLADLEAMAIARSPGLSASASRITAARGTWVQEGLRKNPSAGYMAEEIGSEGQAGLHGMFVEQQITTGGKRRFRRAVAAWEISAAEQQWNSTRLATLKAVRQAYYDVLLARRRARSANELADIAGQAADIAEQLLVAREGDRIGLLQARNERQMASINLDKAKLSEQSAWRRLRALTGIAVEPAPLSGDVERDLPELDWESTLAQLKAESPSIALASAEVGRARAAVDRARAERIPDIDARASVLYDDAIDDTVAGVEFGVPLTIYDRNQGNIQKACAELVAAQRNLERVELDLERQLAEALRRYQSARAEIERYQREILPGTSEALDLVRKSYRVGEVDYTRVLLAQRTYIDATLVWLGALEEAWRTAIEIESGLLLDVPPTGM